MENTIDTAMPVKEKRNKKLIKIGAGILIVSVIIGVIVYFLLQGAPCPAGFNLKVVNGSIEAYNPTNTVYYVNLTKTVQINNTMPYFTCYESGAGAGYQTEQVLYVHLYYNGTDNSIVINELN